MSVRSVPLIVERAISQTSCNLLNSVNATTVDTNNTVLVGNAWNTASSTRYMIASFDISALVGCELIKADWGPWIRNSTPGTGGGSLIWLNARRVLRAYNSAQATWNVYQTGSNWTTVGGQGVTTDVAQLRDGCLFVENNTASANLGSMSVIGLVKAALAANETTFRVQLGGEDGTQGGNAITFASSAVPVITVRYVPASRAIV